MIGTLEMILILSAIVIVFYGNGRLKMMKKIDKIVNELINFLFPKIVHI